MKTEGTNGTSIINTMSMSVDERNKVTSVVKGSQIRLYNSPAKDFAAENMEFVTIPAHTTELVEEMEK